MARLARGKGHLCPHLTSLLSSPGNGSPRAENDLKNAAHTLKLGADCLTDTVCFHSQQCVEKYLKASLVILEIAFPRTHDIEVLIGLLPKHVCISLTIEQQRRLTE